MPDQEASAGGSAEPQTVGSLLAALRKERGLSGVRLGRRVGISQSKLSKIENGTAVAKVGDVRKLAEALDASPDQLRRMVELATAGQSDLGGWHVVKAQSDIIGLEARAAESSHRHGDHHAGVARSG